MSPLDLLRRALPATASEHAFEEASASASDKRPSGGHSSLAVLAGKGALAGLWTLAPMLLIASLLWLTTAGMQESWPEALIGGTSFWLLAHGVTISASSGVLGIMPLAAFAGVLLIGVWSAGRALWAAAEHGYRPALRAALAWAAGYAALLTLVGALSFAGPFDLDLTRWVAAIVVVPLLMGITGMVRALDHDDVDEFLERCYVPAAVRRGWRPAVHTTAVILAAGTLAAIVAVAWSFGDIWALQRDLRPGVSGGFILAALQALALPNIGLWISSFVAGPGFSVVDGASVTWDGSQTALVPMIPVFAAHPEPTVFPDATILVASVVVLLGGWLGWQCLAATARLASLWAKARTILSAAISTGALIALLDWVGGGSLGIGRLADIGAPAGLLGLAITGWLLLGALVVLAWEWRTLDQ